MKRGRSSGERVSVCWLCLGSSSGRQENDAVMMLTRDDTGSK